MNEKYGNRTKPSARSYSTPPSISAWSCTCIEPMRYTTFQQLGWWTQKLSNKSYSLWVPSRTPWIFEAGQTSAMDLYHGRGFFIWYRRLNGPLDASMYVFACTVEAFFCEPLHCGVMEIIFLSLIFGRNYLRVLFRTRSKLTTTCVRGYGVGQQKTCMSLYFALNICINVVNNISSVHGYYSYACS